MLFFSSYSFHHFYITSFISSHLKACPSPLHSGRLLELQHFLLSPKPPLHCPRGFETWSPAVCPTGYYGLSCRSQFSSGRAWGSLRRRFGPGAQVGARSA